MNMKLWILKRKMRSGEVLAFDEFHGFVVCANSSVRARELASKQSGDEGPDVWTNPRASTCQVVRTDGERIVMRDFNAA